MKARLRWPRSLRARLVAIYTLTAAVLGVAGLAAFSLLLQRGELASIDASLEARAAPLADQLSTPVAALTTPPPTTPTTTDGAGNAGDQAGAQDGSGNDASGLDSFAAIYRPDGHLAQIRPAVNGPGPLTPRQLAAARAGREYMTISGGDGQLRVLTQTVARPDGIWVVAVGTDFGNVTDATNKAIRALEITLPILIFLAAVGAWILSGAALRPVERMRADAANLSEHDPANRITVPDTADELANLARTFNSLLDRLTRSLGRQRKLVADAGHELRTPLALLRTELELADTPGRSREELADSIAHARGELERLSKVADDLLFLARADGAAPLVQPSEINLSDVAADAVRGHRAQAESLDKAIVLAAPERLTAHADPAALRRALDNLIANALAATGPGGEVTVSITQADHQAVIEVSDNGPGFPPEFIPHAFGRFTRPDDARSGPRGGAGLGLAIVAEIVDAHGGTATAANNPAGGATVTLTIPA